MHCSSGLPCWPAKTTDTLGVFDGCQNPGLTPQDPVSPGVSAPFMDARQGCQAGEPAEQDAPVTYGSTTSRRES